jgi:hypothetical protein
MERISRAKNRMRQSRSSGTVGGEGGNLLAYPAKEQGAARRVDQGAAVRDARLDHQQRGEAAVLADGR